MVKCFTVAFVIDASGIDIVRASNQGVADQVHRFRFIDIRAVDPAVSGV